MRFLARRKRMYKTYCKALRNGTVPTHPRMVAGVLTIAYSDKHLDCYDKTLNADELADLLQALFVENALGKGWE